MGTANAYWITVKTADSVVPSEADIFEVVVADTVFVLKVNVPLVHDRKKEVSLCLVYEPQLIESILTIQDYAIVSHEMERRLLSTQLGGMRRLLIEPADPKPGTPPPTPGGGPARP